MLELLFAVEIRQNGEFFATVDRHSSEFLGPQFQRLNYREVIIWGEMEQILKKGSEIQLIFDLHMRSFSV